MAEGEDNNVILVDFNNFDDLDDFIEKSLSTALESQNEVNDAKLCDIEMINQEILDMEKFTSDIEKDFKSFDDEIQALIAKDEARNEQNNNVDDSDVLAPPPPLLEHYSDDDDEDIKIINEQKSSAVPAQEVQIKISVGMDLIGHRKYRWLPCKLVKIINASQKVTEQVFSVQFKDQMKTEILHAPDFAFCDPCPLVLPVGSKVLVGRHGVYTQGIIAEPPSPVNSQRFLIFFYDGDIDYAAKEDVHLIAKYQADKQCSDMVPQMRKFAQQYLENYPERLMVKKLKKGQMIRVENGLKWSACRVKQVDASMVELIFDIPTRRTEWLYRGSTKLEPIHRKFAQLERQANSQQQSRVRISGTGHRMLGSSMVEVSSSPQRPKKRPPVRSAAFARKSTAMGGGGGSSCSSASLSNHGIEELSVAQLERMGGSLREQPQQVPAQACYRASAVKKVYRAHVCSPHCTQLQRVRPVLGSNPLMVPSRDQYAFQRQLCLRRKIDSISAKDGRTDIVYRAPCGRRLTSIQEVDRYLALTDSPLTIDLFSFDPGVHTLMEFKPHARYLSQPDISNGREQIPISCVNNVKDCPLPQLDYVTERTPDPNVPFSRDPNFLAGCNCADNCMTSDCACYKLTLEATTSRPSALPDYSAGYKNRRLMDQVLTGIYECNENCGCDYRCRNRVIQNGLTQRLQLFRTELKGWGVRTLADIPEGAFVCVYVGRVLTEEAANQEGRAVGDEYMADLDFIELADKHKEGYESDVASDEDEDYLPLRSRENRDTPDSVSSSTSSVMSSSNENLHSSTSTRSQFPTNDSFLDGEISRTRTVLLQDPQVYVMDAKFKGNIGRYLNHSCDPNCFVQNVFHESHDIRFPSVAFFASKVIKAGEELTWNYNYEIGSVPGKTMYCHCMTESCTGRLL